MKRIFFLSGVVVRMLVLWASGEKNACKQIIPKIKTICISSIYIFYTLSAIKNIIALKSSSNKFLLVLLLLMLVRKWKETEAIES